MKRTPFYQKHLDRNAKMVEFGGYEMPVQYPTGIITEHKAVREGAGGVFDVSHMGEFDVTGPDALNFLQSITANDVATLTHGKAQYSCLPNNEGGIIDDLIVYFLDDNHYMIVVNASTADKDWKWFTEHTAGFDVTLRNDSDRIALLAIQGKKALEILQQLTPVDLQAIEYYHFNRGKFAGVDAIISRTGYTGEPGFEVYLPVDDNTPAVWDKIFEIGAPLGLIPIGLGARDTLRLEMGYCLYGNDIDDTTNPLEAGLGWITKLKKQPPCHAFPAIEQAKAAGINRKLIGFITDEKGAIMRHGHPIYQGDAQIGVITSGTISPMLGKAIALGYIPKAIANPGEQVTVELRPGKRITATVAKPPFVQPGVKS